MKLPNAQAARIDRRKVVDYLLDATHPDNGGKADFFNALGFHRESPQALVDALRGAAVVGRVVDQTSSIHGIKYVVDSRLDALRPAVAGRLVRTVWIIEGAGDAPRLVTAYLSPEGASQ